MYKYRAQLYTLHFTYPHFYQNEISSNQKFNSNYDQNDHHDNEISNNDNSFLENTTCDTNSNRRTDRSSESESRNYRSEQIQTDSANENRQDMVSTDNGIQVDNRSPNTGESQEIEIRNEDSRSMDDGRGHEQVLQDHGQNQVQSLDHHTQDQDHQNIIDLPEPPKQPFLDSNSIDDENIESIDHNEIETAEINSSNVGDVIHHHSQNFQDPNIQREILVNQFPNQSNSSKPVKITSNNASFPYSYLNGYFDSDVVGVSAPLENTCIGQNRLELGTPPPKRENINLHANMNQNLKHQNLNTNEQYEQIDFSINSENYFPFQLQASQQVSQAFNPTMQDLNTPTHSNTQSADKIEKNNNHNTTSTNAVENTSIQAASATAAAHNTSIKNTILPQVPIRSMDMSSSNSSLQDQGDNFTDKYFPGKGRGGFWCKILLKFYFLKKKTKKIYLAK